MGRALEAALPEAPLLLNRLDVVRRGDKNPQALHVTYSRVGLF